MNGLLALPLLLVGMIVLAVFVIISRYKRCPSDKILVVYGKVGSDKDGQTNSAKCVHGGAAFIWPIFQAYQFLDLIPVSIDVNLTNALSRQNIRVDVPSRFTVGISTDPLVMQNAAERLLGLNAQQIQDLARDIIVGQLRLVIAMMDIEEINFDRDKFLSNIANNVESELRKIGLKLINVNITDIKDESGYIEALGKEAAAKAVNDARKSVAEKTRDGSIGESEAHRDERIRVSQADAMAKKGEAAANAEAVDGQNSAEVSIAESAARKRQGEAAANAEAVDGENSAKISIAESNAKRREKEAEANRIAIASEKVQQAKALEEAYFAEQKAEEARAAKAKATQIADVVVKAEIAKSKTEIDAEAEAERIRRKAKGEADAIYYKLEAEAKGQLEILNKQAEGFSNIIEAAGGDAREAVLLMIADKLPELVKTQVEAIKGIKIDKVTVWDSNGGNGGDGNGNTATANFLSGMYKAVPPLEDLFKMAGMELPGYLGKTLEEQSKIKSSSATEITDVEEVK